MLRLTHILVNFTVHPVCTTCPRCKISKGENVQTRTHARTYARIPVRVMFTARAHKVSYQECYPRKRQSKSGVESVSYQSRPGKSVTPTVFHHKRFIEKNGFTNSAKEKLLPRGDGRYRKNVKPGVFYQKCPKVAPQECVKKIVAPEQSATLRASLGNCVRPFDQDCLTSTTLSSPQKCCLQSAAGRLFSGESAVRIFSHHPQLDNPHCKRWLACNMPNQVASKPGRFQVASKN